MYIEAEIIDNSEYSKEKELTDDLIQIITVFANRLYGQRSKKTKRLIDEMKNNADNEKVYDEYIKNGKIGKKALVTVLKMLI